MRLDKLLWFLRFAASRNFAHDWVIEGHIRLNGRRIAKPGQAIKPGDVLTLPLRSRAQVVAILVLPDRRGPAEEAQACYRVLDERLANPIADETTTIGPSAKFGDPMP
jgi:ribosome-associated heat shock protein Hsp15